MDSLPRLLADFTPIPGQIKTDATDFLVEEVPLYPCDEVGTHTYFLVEKQGLSTMQAIHEIARTLNVRRYDIGFAGLKDARAVTRQWMSLEHVPPERIAEVVLPGIRVLETHRHGNKLKIGHLRGNRFTIRVRTAETTRLAELQDALAVLAARGVPNYFGEQRFGYRGDTWLIGRAILRGEIDEAVGHILGRPTERDYGEIRRARELFDRGEYEAARARWPRIFQSERRALAAILKSGGRLRRGFHAIDRTTRSFYVSAYQSHLFNQVVVARLPQGLGQLEVGDLAWLHASGAVFKVEDLAQEQPRADRFDISPSGPLFGYRCSRPGGRPGEAEARLLAEQSLRPDAFKSGALRVKGGRRPLRFPVIDARASAGEDARGPYFELNFQLPRGCYATIVLRELFALRPVADEGEDAEGAADS